MGWQSVGRESGRVSLPLGWSQCGVSMGAHKGPQTSSCGFSGSRSGSVTGVVLFVLQCPWGMSLMVVH